ncbi:MAG: carboxypeptidase-like regulatory domain-containing protein [Deltaproteobacteria bacterium]|nr:carboxypeptidase-like regulatory domain-containing protein [Deltaproteobacteria bacterium]
MRVASVIVALLAGNTLFACGPGVLADGLPAGEGEGEGEPRVLPDIGEPPSGYSTTPPADAPGERCSTQQWWFRGDRESAAMRPGYDCVDCHRARRDGPIDDVMGTVFFGVDDEDDCRGIPGVRVDILDADGNLAFSTTTNSGGNFRASSAAMPSPYFARVSYEGRVREMATSQTDGSCNRCHTQAGIEDAPGRIMLP